MFGQIHLSSDYAHAYQWTLAARDREFLIMGEKENNIARRACSLKLQNRYFLFRPFPRVDGGGLPICYRPPSPSVLMLRD